MSADRPVACSLAGEGLAERRREFGELLDGSLLSVAREGAAALRLELADSPGLGERLARIVELERACCPFLEIELLRRGERLDVRIEGPPGAEAVIDMFAKAAAGGRV